MKLQRQTASSISSQKATSRSLPLEACSRSLERARHLDLLEHFDLVPDLNVVIALHADTAFHASTHFGHVVLEAAQGFQLAFKNDHVLTQYTDRTVTVHQPLEHHATGNRTKLRRAEDVAHFGNTQDILPNITAEHTGERLLDVLDDVVNDVVVAHVQAFGLDNLARSSISPHVEAKQYGVGSQCQVGIGFGDTADTTADYAHLHFVIAQAVERTLQSFQGTTHIGLEDDVERLLLVLAHGLEDVLQLAGVSTGQLHFAELALTEQCYFASLLLVGDDSQVITGFRRTIQAENLDRNSRASFFDLLAALIEHGADATEGHTAQNHITLTQSTVLDQHGCYRTTTLVKTRFDHDTAAWRRRGCLELENFGLQQHGFEQLINAGTHLGGHRNERRVTAPLFRHHIQRGQAVLDVVRIGFGLVDLVDCNDQGHPSGFRMLDRFLCLRHDAIISCHHQDHDIGRLRTTGTHGGKRGVTRGIQEGHHAALGLNVVGADMLGDAASFARGDLGATNVVEQRGLAMVDVTHHDHNRYTSHCLAFAFHRFSQLLFKRVVAVQPDLVARFFSHQLC